MPSDLEKATTEFYKSVENVVSTSSDLAKALASEAADRVEILRAKAKEVNSNYQQVQQANPSVDKFNSCKEQHGVSAWDTKGRWNCLFGDQKESFLNGTSKEAFFADYKNFLEWQWHNKASGVASRDCGSIFAKKNGEKRAVKVEEHVTLTNNRGHWQKRCLRKTVYDDGTASVVENSGVVGGVKKSAPAASSGAKSEAEAAKSGWFWSK